VKYLIALVVLFAVIVGCVELRVAVGTEGSQLDSRKGIGIGGKKEDKDASRSENNPN